MHVVASLGIFIKLICKLDNYYIFDYFLFLNKYTYPVDRSYLGYPFISEYLLNFLKVLTFISDFQ